MRIYSAANEEAFRARKLLKDWASEGLISAEQRAQLEKDSVFDLRTTNLFLRIVLFFFTVLGAAAAIGLFFEVLVPNASEQEFGYSLLFFAVLSYATAEAVLSQARLYRYGIEEAFAACSVAFLSAGLDAAFSHHYGDRSATSIALAAGAAASLWVWRRFGLWYAFLAAEIFVAAMTGFWTSVPTAQRELVVLFYSLGLALVIAVRKRHRFDFLNSEYSLAEALLWLGIFCAINLKILALDPRLHTWGFDARGAHFTAQFYWATWVLTWILPALVLARAIRSKDRWVLAVGLLSATLTLVTNKPYLGWQRNTWDPMLLGIFLAGVALFVRRWLAQMPGGVRRGFTAARLSARDKQWLNVAAPALGLAATRVVAPHAEAQSAGVQFGGGHSGGGGASGEF